LEHGLMKTEELQVAASKNLIQTYIRLGMATPSATWSREEGFDLCLGDLDHPICNFAADLNLDPWSARRLATIAQSRPCFNVYVTTGDKPEYLDELLSSAGFLKAYRLVELVAQPTDEESHDSMEPCTPELRLPVACFMVDQFFAQRSYEFRVAIAKATALAPGVELFYAGDPSRFVSAVMLSDSDEMLGCYNLCVAPASRGRGIGSSMVRWVVSEAGKRGKPVTMQCEPHLEGWYNSLGFERCGWLNVYQLPKSPTSDIIEET
jgi:GNAT superfamily N-acetyltransferase